MLTAKNKLTFSIASQKKRFGFVEKLIEAFQEVGMIDVDEGQLFDDFAAFVKLWPTKTE